MYTAKVIGHVVATQKDASLAGAKLLIVMQVDSGGQSRGRPQRWTQSARGRTSSSRSCAVGKPCRCRFPCRRWMRRLWIVTHARAVQDSEPSKVVGTIVATQKNPNFVRCRCSYAMCTPEGGLTGSGSWPSTPSAPARMITFSLCPRELVAAGHGQEGCPIDSAVVGIV